LTSDQVEQQKQAQVSKDKQLLKVYNENLKFPIQDEKIKPLLEMI
jgi:hypothetical protein